MENRAVRFGCVAFLVHTRNTRSAKRRITPPSRQYGSAVVTIPELDLSVEVKGQPYGTSRNVHIALAYDY
ncbi:hypothetical protein EBH_0069270 [Eimeria brunetti]|uniref:Uncharacterized protein n=1 Tax=Eimeria brunetti TaxID=51314 RepID=U6LXP4_9EIME|nr:hypothetical protein EBH_0069270 [Eimeria brunetti]